MLDWAIDFFAVGIAIWVITKIKALERENKMLTRSIAEIIGRERGRVVVIDGGKTERKENGHGY